MATPPVLDHSAHLSSLLSVWAQSVRDHVFPTDVSPWWLDYTALLQSIMHATEGQGWRVEPRLKPNELSEEWDLHLTAPDTRMAIRCVCAGVQIGDGRDVITDAWRVLSIMELPPKGTMGVHLVAVLPLISKARDDAWVKSKVAKWLKESAWSKGDGLSVWIEADTPMPRNSAGTVFPGLGLMARKTK